MPPATIPLGKKPPVPTEQEISWVPELAWKSLLLGHPTHELVTTLTEVLESNYLHVFLISTYFMKNNKSVQSLWGGTHHVHLPRGEPIVSVTV
jgi:hypothetical protein